MEKIELKLYDKVIFEEFNPNLTLNELAKEIHKNAVEHGFWEDPNFGVQIALVHSELSEALEEHRVGHAYNEIYGMEGIPIELADAVIRILDMCGGYGIDIEKAIQMKMEYNSTREHKHGKRY